MNEDKSDLGNVGYWDQQKREWKAIYRKINWSDLYDWLKFNTEKSDAAESPEGNHVLLLTKDDMIGDDAMRSPERVFLYLNDLGLVFDEAHPTLMRNISKNDFIKIVGENWFKAFQGGTFDKEKQLFNAAQGGIGESAAI